MIHDMYIINTKVYVCPKGHEQSYRALSLVEQNDSKIGSTDTFCVKCLNDFLAQRCPTTPRSTAEKKPEAKPQGDLTAMALAWFAEQPKLYEDQHFFVVYDRFPVRKGHALIVAKRADASSFIFLEGAEMVALQPVITKTITLLLAEHQPVGFNVGTNIGRAAGQVVMRFHMHVIPRYHDEEGDKIRFEEEVSQARVV